MPELKQRNKQRQWINQLEKLKQKSTRAERNKFREELAKEEATPFVTDLMTDLKGIDQQAHKDLQLNIALQDEA